MVGLWGEALPPYPVPNGPSPITIRSRPSLAGAPLFAHLVKVPGSGDHDEPGAAAKGRETGTRFHGSNPFHVRLLRE